MRIGVGLSIPELATRGGRFSPASLFTSGVAGVWYDPSDINNYMAGLGPELVTNGDFSNGTTGWTAGNSATLSVTSGRLSVVNGATALGQGRQTITTVAGRTYRISVAFTSISASRGYVFVGTFAGDNSRFSAGPLTTSQTVNGYFTAAGTTTHVSIGNADNTAGLEVQFDDVTVQEVTTIANATLFQDSAGTTPVTAVEQPVGLMLDKSQGLVLGSDVVTNGDFSGGSTGWTLGTGWAVGSGVATHTGATAGYLSQAGKVTIGKTYKITVTITASDGRGLQLIGAFWSPGVTIGSAAGTYTVYATALDTTLWLYANNAGTTLSIDNVVVNLLPGNHASQATAASRPVLRARYNLLTYSEQFDNAAWTKTGTTTTGTANAAVAPDGTMTADKIVEVAAASTPRVGFGGAATTISAVYTLSVYAQAAERDQIRIVVEGSGLLGPFFLLTGSGSVSNAESTTSSITNVGNGWYRCVVTYTAGATNPNFYIATASGGAVIASGDNTKGVLLWGADFRTGSSAGTYQRIAAATDYATAGFLPYLALDGTDDSFGTGSIDFSATDKMFLCAGLTKNSDAALGMVLESSTNLSSNNGTFWLLAPLTTGASGDFDASFKGTNQVQVNSGVRVAPVTAVVTATSNIAGPTAVFRYNGTQTELDVGSQGTGNYGNYPLYIGRRANASLPFNGRIYQIVVCGKTLSAAELASTEAFVNSKTGAY